MGYEMGKSLTSRKSAHSFVPGKNWIRKIREKSGFEIPANFDQILGTIHRKESIYEVIKKYFEIFIRLNIFDFEIFKTKCTNSIKIPPDLHFP